MNYYSIFKAAIPAVVLAFVACSSDDDVIEKNPTTQVSGEVMKFSATIESDDISRATMSISGSTWNTSWENTDEINVFNSTGTTAPFSITKIENNVATFEKKAGGASLGDTAPYYAVYANSSNALTPGASGVLTGSIPYTYTSSNISTILVNGNEFKQTYRYLVACSNENNLSFKNVLSFIRIKAQASNDFPFTTIKIVANNQEKIAGNFSVTIGKATAAPTCEAATGASSYIEIAVADMESHEYLIPVIPSSLSKGFTLLFETDFDNATTKKCQRIYQRVMNKKFDFDRLKIHDLGEYTYNGNGTKMSGDILDNVVDLGLPSGTLWCTQNIDGGLTTTTSRGQTIETNTLKLAGLNAVGGYYSWAEIYRKQDYAYKQPWANNNDVGSYSFYSARLASRDEKYQSYKYGMGAADWLASVFDFDKSYSMIEKNFLNSPLKGLLSRYNSSSDYENSNLQWFGTARDYVTILATDDDAAYKMVGNRMCMPTESQFTELVNLTISSETVNSKSVYKISSSLYSDRYITLPPGGYKHMEDEKDNNNVKSGTVACYWTKNRSAEAVDSYKAKSVNISGTAGTVYDAERCQGRLIRAVVMNNAIAPANTYADLKRTSTQRQ